VAVLEKVEPCREQRQRLRGVCRDQNGRLFALALAVTCGHHVLRDATHSFLLQSASVATELVVFESKAVEDDVDDRGCCTREQASLLARGSRDNCQSVGNEDSAGLLQIDAVEDDVDGRGCCTREQASPLT
jgi:hypothetical protein